MGDMVVGGANGGVRRGQCLWSQSALTVFLVATVTAGDGDGKSRGLASQCQFASCNESLLRRTRSKKTNYSPFVFILPTEVNDAIAAYIVGISEIWPYTYVHVLQNHLWNIIIAT